MYQLYITLFHSLNKWNVLPTEETASVVIFKVGNKNSDLNKKIKGLKMHIETKETFSNMLRNFRFTFSHL